jgi:hypothetical protein
MTTTHTDGLSSATSIPVGATIVSTRWHIAGHYGPSIESYDTQRDALVAGIAQTEERVAQYSRGQHHVSAERLTVDLRWKMKWPANSPDANGRTSPASGIETTVSRSRYETLADAREHLDRIDRYSTVGA